ncbi:MAG: glutamate--tRNA ligase [Acidobacteriota bacterium]|nr:MAG: glutamate--tRNA ligase [Acidobacteriota bacterium]
MSVRVRFAPSPTGFLHVGNVRTALFNWLFARKSGGTFILRVEDTDAERSESRFEEQLIADMRWLGLDWDEGVEVGGERGPYQQKKRLSLYRKWAGKLLSKGDAYYCFCSAEQLEADREAQRESGIIKYSGRCRDLDRNVAKARVRAGEEATIRLRVREGKTSFEDLVYGPIEVDTSTIGDFILVRSDGSAQYNLACTIDDALMEITHVIRGEGHISNTHRQLLIYEALGFEPPRFAHLSTILGPDGSKLSKRHGATSIAEFRELGYLPEATINYLSLLGWSPAEDGNEILQVEQIVREFTLERVNVSPATFDLEKFNWVNRSHLKMLSAESSLELALPYLKKAGLLPDPVTSETRNWGAELAALLIPYIDRFSELSHQAQFVSAFNPELDLASPDVRDVLDQEGAIEVVTAFRDALNASESQFVDFECYKACVIAAKEQTGQKGKNLFRPIRVAITARASGPELEKILPVIETGSQLELPVAILGVKERVNRVSDQLVAV